MKTFRTLTFVTATTAVVAAATLFTIEQTKVEKKFFDNEAPTSEKIGNQVVLKHKQSFKGDTLQLHSQKQNSPLSKTASIPISKSPQDSLKKEEILTR